MNVDISNFSRETICAPIATVRKFFQISRHEKRPSQLEALNTMPLYPTEDIIWNENIVPTEYFSGDGCLALPKLNLQFLTLHDYLLRNFNLFRLESTCEYEKDFGVVQFRILVLDC